MKMIVAADVNWGIGKDNNLLAHIPGDLKYFKEKTTGKIIVMGRRTLESLPGGSPLPNRVNIVLSSSAGPWEGCTVCRSREDLFRELEQYDTDDVFIIGGAKVYGELLPYCDTVFVTKIDKAFDADRHIPCLDALPGMELAWESEIQEHNGTCYKFTEYRRK